MLNRVQLTQPSNFGEVIVALGALGLFAVDAFVGKREPYHFFIVLSSIRMMSPRPTIW